MESIKPTIWVKVKEEVSLSRLASYYINSPCVFEIVTSLGKFVLLEESHDFIHDVFFEIVVFGLVSRLMYHPFLPVEFFGLINLVFAHTIKIFHN